MEYKKRNLVRGSRKGQLILGCNNTDKKLKMQRLLKKFYHKRYDFDSTLPRNPFPYAFNSANRKRRDNKLLEDLGSNITQ